MPGEDLPHVHARYVSGYPFHGRDVVVVGGKNSAAEAALDLYRHGARVTMVVRGGALSERVKYWIKPDLENRIAAGAIRALFGSRVVAIERDAVRVPGPRETSGIPADAVFPLIGYEPDFALFERCGIRLEGESRTPAHDPETLESNVPGLYLAGAILGGRETGRIFIENSRHHAGMIAVGIERRLEGGDGVAASCNPGPSARVSGAGGGHDDDRMRPRFGTRTVAGRGTDPGSGWCWASRTSERGGGRRCRRKRSCGRRSRRTSTGRSRSSCASTRTASTRTRCA